MTPDQYNGTAIPEQFDNSKYDRCGEWGYERWRTALAQRIRLKAEIDQALLLGNEPFPYDERLLGLQRKAEYLLEMPIPTEDIRTPFTYLPWRPVEDRRLVDEYTTSNKLADDGYQRLLREKLDSLCSVAIDEPDESPFRKADGAPFQVFRLPLPPALREKELDRLRESYFRTTSLWEIEKSRRDFSNEFHVKVNLSFSDDEILLEFKKWLKSTKGAAGISTRKRSITSGDLRRWAYYRVLPYIDLQLYADIFKVKFTRQSVADAIFGTDFEFDSLTMTKKTTRDLATRLLQRSYYDSMRYSE